MASCKTSQLILNKSWEIATVVLAFIIAPVVLIFLCPLILSMLAQRQLLKWYLQWQKNSRFTLMTPLDSLTSLETPPKVVGYTTCFLVESGVPFSHSNFLSMREKIAKMLNTQMYRKLKCRQSTKWGFCCWEDMEQEKDAFNITNHVKLFPGADDWNKIYSESQLMAVIQTRINVDLDAKNRPAWEVLVVPQVKIKSENQIATYKQQLALIIRINHGYMDARSFKEFFKRCLFDDEVTSRPAAQKPGNIYKFGLLINGVSILYAIAINLRDSLRHRKHVIPSTGASDSYRLAYMKFEGFKLNRIRATFKSETLAVFCSALMAALNELASRKGRILPKSLNVALSTTVDNLLSDDSGNLFNVYCRFPSFKETNPDAMLRTINDAIRLSPSDSLELSGNFVLFWSLGCLPAVWTRTLFKFMEFRSIALTTLPMAEQVYRFQGGEVTSVFSTVRPIFGVACSLAAIYYRGRYHVGIGALDNQLVANYHDMEGLAENFEMHINRLEKLAMKTPICRQSVT